MEASARWPWRWVRAWETAAVQAALGPLPGARVLELGCGAGHYTRLLAEVSAEVVAVDASAAMVARLPANVRGLVGDAATVPLDGVFDGLLSAGMLEFVPDPEAVLRHGASVVRSGGWAVLLVPRTSILGTAYQRFHRGHGLDIALFDVPGIRSLSTLTGWRMVGSRDVLPFAMVVELERT